MNEFVVGIGLGLATAVATLFIAEKLPPDLFNRFFALMLASAAAVYVGGALTKPYGLEMIISSTVFLGFFFVALRWGNVLRILAVAWFLHGLWDFAAYFHLVQTDIANWYKIACAVADVVWGGYLYYKAK